MIRWYSKRSNPCQTQLKGQTNTYQDKTVVGFRVSEPQYLVVKQSTNKHGVDILEQLTFFSDPHLDSPSTFHQLNCRAAGSSLCKTQTFFSEPKRSFYQQLVYCKLDQGVSQKLCSKDLIKDLTADQQRLLTPEKGSDCKAAVGSLDCFATGFAYVTPGTRLALMNRAVLWFMCKATACRIILQCWVTEQPGLHCETIQGNVDLENYKTV